MLIFCIKNADISQINGFMEPKAIFSETIYKCVLRVKKQAFSIILRSLDRGGSTFTPIPPLQTTL